MRQFAIQSPAGRFNYFRATAQAARDAIVAKRPFGTSWLTLYQAGYRCVKVNIQVLQDCSLAE